MPKHFSESNLILKTMVSIAFLFFSFCSFGQINDDYAFFDGSYSKDYIRKQKIKAVMKTSYMDSNKLPTTMYYFDKNGLLERESAIDSNGKEETRFVFKFNQYGDMVQRVTLATNKFGADTIVFNKKYINHKISEESSTTLPVTIKHFYNKKGDKIKTMHPFYNGRGTLSRRIIEYDYDTTGKLIHVTDRIYSNLTDNIEQWMSDRTITYTGDKMHRIIEKIPNGEIPNNDGNLTYSYDSTGNVATIMSDTVCSYYFNYDNKGLLKSKTTKFPEGFVELAKAKIVDEYSYSFWN